MNKKILVLIKINSGLKAQGCCCNHRSRSLSEQAFSEWIRSRHFAAAPALPKLE